MNYTNFNFVRYRGIWYTISGLFFVGSLILIFWFGLPFGIDFTGGSLLTVKYSTTTLPSVQSLKTELESFGYGSFNVQPAEDKTFILRSRFLTPEDESSIVNKLQTNSQKSDPKSQISVIASSAIGPIIGEELKRNALISIVLVLLAIVAFISYAFRQVSYPVKSWKYGLIAVLALIHDVVITTGVYVLLGKFFGAEIDILFVTALLTILGFSVHDTIVVFDRTRENLKTMSQKPFSEVVNLSLNQTAGRSLATSITTMLVLLAIIIFGGNTVRWFVTTLFMGIGFGTYSSIFLASPLLVDWQGKNR